MLRYLQPFNFANTARLLRTQFKGVIVIVEGITDEIVYEKIFNNCKFIITENKEIVEETVNILQKTKFDFFLGIVDADFDRLENIDRTKDNLFITDYHDLECMILKTTAIEEVFKEIKVQISYEEAEEFIENLLNVILPISFLRWLSSKYKKNYGLNFKNLDFNEFLNEEKFQIDIDKLIDKVIANTYKCKYDFDTVKRELLDLIENNIVEKWELCNGHDLVKIIFIRIKQIKSDEVERMQLKKFEKLLRESYKETFFAKTNLYLRIKEWEKRNKLNLLNL